MVLRALETTRRHALATLKRQQPRVIRSMSCLVSHRVGYPTPGLEQLQDDHSHDARSRQAWFERYVSDTNKTLILTGHLKGIQPKALVQRVLVRSASIGVDTPAEKTQSPVGAKRDNDFATQYRDTPRCILEKPNRLERETLRCLATALKARFEDLEPSHTLANVQVDVRTSDDAEHSFLRVVIPHKNGQRAQIQKRLADIVQTLKSIPSPFDEFRRIRQNTVGPADLELTCQNVESLVRTSTQHMTVL